VRKTSSDYALVSGGKVYTLKGDTKQIDKYGFPGRQDTATEASETVLITHRFARVKVHWLKRLASITRGQQVHVGARSRTRCDRADTHCPPDLSRLPPQQPPAPSSAGDTALSASNVFPSSAERAILT
jgi:hypothetical protein